MPIQFNRYTCIKRFKESNDKILGYELLDTVSKETIKVESDMLKALIKANKIKIDNLKITLDYRIIILDDKGEIQDIFINKKPEENREIELNKIISTYDNKCKITYGYCPFLFKLVDNKIYITNYISNDNLEEISIPGFVDGFIKYEDEPIFGSYCNLRKIKCKSNKLNSLHGVFSETCFNELDLCEFNTSNITNMAYAFYKTKIKTLNISSWNTSKVTNMDGMFKGLWFVDDVYIDNAKREVSYTRKIVKTLTLSQMYGGGNFGKMSGMVKTHASKFDYFNYARYGFMYDDIIDTCMIKAQLSKCLGHLDLSTFDTGNVETMNEMFMKSIINKLSIENFRTTKVSTMCSMFELAVIRFVNLQSINTKNTKYLNNMFKEFSTEKFNGKFKHKKDSKTKDMFKDMVSLT